VDGRGVPDPSAIVPHFVDFAKVWTVGLRYRRFEGRSIITRVSF